MIDTQLGIAGPLAVAVDGALDVHGPRINGGQRVGHRAAGVVVAVDAELSSDLLVSATTSAIQVGQHATVRVAEHDDLRTGPAAVWTTSNAYAGFSR